MARILIVGGGGYIGVVLAETLLRAGESVTLLDRFFFGRELVTPLSALGQFAVVRDDSRSVTPKHFEGFDAVVDLAGLSNDPSCDLDPALTEAINIGGAANVARCARKAGVARLVYSSSCSVYGQGEGTASEDSQTRPVSLYARTKLAAEGEVLSLSDETLHVTALRNATVYGVSPRMRFDLLVNLMTLFAFERGRIFVLGGGEQWRPLVHVRDVARAFLLVLRSSVTDVAAQVINIGSDRQNHQVSSVASLIARLIPRTVIEAVPDDPDKRSYRVDFARARKLLGFEPEYDVVDGIREVLEALQDRRVDQGIRSRTVEFYRYLIEADRVVREVSYRGRIL